LVSANGNKTREIKVNGAAQQALLEQASAARESLSGVNLDEEAANLLRFQQAYQASAKVIDIGSKLFDVLLAINA
jgi:flagellar hook-associated protein 1 FlgK